MGDQHTAGGPPVSTLPGEVFRRMLRLSPIDSFGARFVAVEDGGRHQRQRLRLALVRGRAGRRAGR